MKGQTKPDNRSKHSLLPRAFSLVFGFFLGLTLLKFGNPPILEKYVTGPKDPYEFLLYSPWPILWAYLAFSLVAILGFLVADRRWNGPGWLIAMLLVWLGWQFLAGLQSIDSQLSQPTVAHFTVCAACFLLGYFCLSSVPDLASFWLPILGGFVIMLAVGWEQHFGGLEATRRYFFLYVLPQLKEVPPEYLGKMSSNRIFATLFYPNALAGVLLLLLPVLLGAIASMKNAFTFGARSFLIVLVSLAALGCLYWSGSKGGWLLALLLGVVAALRLNLPRGFRMGLISLVLVTGLAGFFWKYASFFQKGATSVGARFDYWQTAAKVTASHPLFGTGPGTFSIPYRLLKRPESEMARLVHNDFLEQACDSGLPGFLAYGVLVLGTIVWTGARIWSSSGFSKSAQLPGLQSTKSRGEAPESPSSASFGLRNLIGTVLPVHQGLEWESFLIWLGLLGWALQGFFEFGLYLPAISWPAFTLMGLLLSRLSRSRASLKPVDKP